MRMGRIGISRVGFVAAALAFAAPSFAGSSPVSLGEVKVEKADPSLQQTFRGMVESELGRLDLSEARSHDHYVLAAALVKMSTRERSGHAESTAIVSATLRRARGGALHAVIQGRARVTDDPKQQRSVELTALRVAVRNALGRVPEAIK